MESKQAARVLANALGNELGAGPQSGDGSISQSIARLGGDQRFRLTLLDVLNDFASSLEGGAINSVTPFAKFAESAKPGGPEDRNGTIQDTPLTYRW